MDTQSHVELNLLLWARQPKISHPLMWIGLYCYGTRHLLVCHHKYHLCAVFQSKPFCPLVVLFARYCKTPCCYDYAS